MLSDGPQNKKIKDPVERELRPGEWLDRYELFDIVSWNKTVTIFRAWDTDRSRMVALKVPRLQNEIFSRQRFLHEEQICRRLDHPAIIKVVPSEEKSRAYLVLEYVGGELLSDRLRSEGRLPLSAAVDFAVQMADALVYLHDQKIVHRDLKPEILLILPEERMKLIDFSIARDLRRPKKKETALPQNLESVDHYMAPEQMNGRRTDERTDIYSFGVIFYEMLTGKIPLWDQSSAVVAGRTKIQKGPLSPRLLQAEVSPPLEAIVLHALERSPRKRFQNAAELREALTHPETALSTDRDPQMSLKARLTRWWRGMLRWIRAT